MIFYRAAREISLYTSRKSLWQTTSDLKKIQQKKLRCLLEHAYTTVPFYHKKFVEAGIKPADIRTYSDLEKIPLLTKTEIKAAGDSIISGSVAKKNCVLHQTSGSTGLPLKIYFTKKDNAAADISYERARRENGYRPFKDVFMEITGSSFLPQDMTWYQKLWPARWYKLNILLPMSEQVSAIQCINPDVMWGYPSAIKNICDNLKIQGISGIHPRLVFTASEVLSDQNRQTIENFLDTDVRDVYGSHETGCIAWECGEHQGYHLSMDTNAVEFLDKNNQHIESDESGRVIVTNLHSYAMPIIRYEIGDYATPAGTACSCKRGGYMIKSINGRNDDFIKLPNEKVLSPMTIIRLMHKYDDAVCQFKLVQENQGKFTLYVIPSPGVDLVLITDQLENDLKSLLGENAVISIISVMDIPREGSLKLRSVISKIQEP
jgi:phenylacetate-CoA ligase